jgi:branched-chain amino acid transport system ATP-binding protein
LELEAMKSEPANSAHIPRKVRNGDVVLRVKDLVVGYGKAEVVHGVSFEVCAGEFVVILGRNGAGKSTTLRAVSALIPKRAGQVEFYGEDLSHAKSMHLVEAGLVHVLEGHRVFQALTVEENLLLGTWATPKRGDRSGLDRIYTLFPELAQKRDHLASRLSGGQQQILAVATGVIAQPRLLVAALCREGMAILLVEQMVETALRFADYGYLIETGRIADAGHADEILASDALSRVYLGRNAATH